MRRRPFWVCNPYEPMRHDPGGVTFRLPGYCSSEASIRASGACLLRHGASVNGRDSEGKTVLRLAQEEWQDNHWPDNQLIRMLKQAGARLKPRGTNAQWILDRQISLLVG